MDFVNHAHQTLEYAIEHLYNTFEHYRLKTSIIACTDCVADSDRARLHAN